MSSPSHRKHRQLGKPIEVELAMATNGCVGTAGNGEHSDAPQMDFGLHKAAFYCDLARVKQLLQRGADPNAQDVHGNTPLHIAVMLGHKEIVDKLVEYGAMVKEKNSLGWTPLDEAISYGDKQTISLLLKTLRDQLTEGLITRRMELIKSLHKLDDFYAELKWEFHTWVPLLSRLLPSDVCRIYKTGSCIRLDSTLGDFTEMRWTRGDLSFVFNGEDNKGGRTLSMVVLNHQTKEYQRMRLLTSDDHLDRELEYHVEAVCKRPIIYANMSTQPVTVSRAQSGWFFRADKSERIGEYDTDVFNITNLILISRKRREHLTQEQIDQQEELARKVEEGTVDETDMRVKELASNSLSSPPPCLLTWDEYIVADEVPHLGRPMNLKVDKKYFKASVCMAQSCPIEMKQLLDILEVITPYKHFHKLRQFVHLKLPPGFPVKLDIPVFPTVTAVITLEKYQQTVTPPSMFLTPRDYTKYVPKRSPGGQGASATNDVDSDPVAANGESEQ